MVSGTTGAALLGVIASATPADAAAAAARRHVTTAASPAGTHTGRPAGSSAAAPVVRSDFAAAIGRQFTARAESESATRAQLATGTHTLTLAAIADLQPAVAAGDENRFALRFTAAGSRPKQGIYRLSCAGVPDAILFVAPVGAADNRMIEAVVNRIG
ncbi:MAG TPA: hypothetical protein VIJ18_12840 [Microbacteriaceae bacterium]